MAEGAERPTEPGLQPLSQVGKLSLPDTHWEVLGKQAIFSELSSHLRKAGNYAHSAGVLQGSD